MRGLSTVPAAWTPAKTEMQTPRDAEGQTQTRNNQGKSRVSVRGTNLNLLNARQTNVPSRRIPADPPPSDRIAVEGSNQV